MALVTILGTDIVKDSRTVINNNFTFLESEIATKTDQTDFDTLETEVGTKADDNAVVKLTGDQTVAGIKTFSSSPIVPAPTTDLQAATKKYVDDASFAGVGDASETAKGVVEEATDAEVTAGTATGATGAKLFVTPAKLLAFFGAKAKLRASKSSGQSVSNTTAQVTFDTEAFDIGSNFASSTFTAPRTGYYHVDFMTSYDSNASGSETANCEIRVNGTAVLRGAQFTASSTAGEGSQITITGLLALSATDTITVYFTASEQTATLLATTNTQLSIIEL
jgi:primosomal replication protein N